MNRSYYSSTIADFIFSSQDEIIGQITSSNEFTLELTQKEAWIEEIIILKRILISYSGQIYFEYTIPRIGQRIDVLLIIDSVIFVLEFKVGEKTFSSYAIDQVTDYALDLKNFHETSHDKYIVPILIATEAKEIQFIPKLNIQPDHLFQTIKTTPYSLAGVISSVIQLVDSQPIDIGLWEKGRYKPTPTIIEAAKALYYGHSVEEISQREAETKNISQTSNAIANLIEYSQRKTCKSICFVTGVPGAGKTLVGLNIANKFSDQKNNLYSVYLSGNGPLVEILVEELTRDQIKRNKKLKIKEKKGVIKSAVKSKIQNVHHFRDDCFKDKNSPPIEHVTLFDEAQRAWNLKQTSNFMKRRKRIPNFDYSEPEFLISCMDRHKDWAVIVCLVGGGQEINTGEAGISEWLKSLKRSFPDWNIYISPQLNDNEYATTEVLHQIEAIRKVNYDARLHLSVSMRSFRAESVSLLISQILDLDAEEAKTTFKNINSKYPILITRSITKAKEWLKSKARGSERYGIVVSSQAERLKPHSIFVKSPMNPIHWFLNGKDDTRSSYYLEDVATEFHVQGLELDWVCLTWDADFRFNKNDWEHWSFRGNKWQRIRKFDRKNYLKNAYRVLLTRARQGMIIVIPKGDLNDHTRLPKYYDPTYNYLKEIGFEEI